MTRQEIVAQIIQKKSFLCVGLDADPHKIPKHLRHQPNPILSFNKSIIDATKDLCVAYKPNTAFYEAMGTKGWDTLAATLDYIPDTHFTIADAKRGDIGNTSQRYAKAFFEEMNFDAITVAPYMGSDSVQPFLDFDKKWVIVLGLTSNQGSTDFQRLRLADSGNMLYQEVIKTIATWGTPDNMMFVVGATHPQDFQAIREIVPKHFLLVPGIGKQGGDLAKVVQQGKNKEVGLLINSARSIIYASQGEDFAEQARAEAQRLQAEMQVSLDTLF